MNWLNEAFGVYRVFGENDEALYVGSAQNPWGRISRHAGQNEQMRQASRVEFTWHSTATEASTVERAEIVRLKPIYNINFPASGRRREAGELKQLIIAAVEALGECTSSDVRTLLGKDVCHTLHPTEIGAVMHRLRQEGVLTVVGTTHSGYKLGRPQFIVRLAA